MSHLFLTNKKGKTIIIHRDTLKESFPTADGLASVCVVNVHRKADEPDTFTVVNESTDEIKRQLKAMWRRPCEGFDAPAATATSEDRRS